jgi:hypothetical protein
MNDQQATALVSWLIEAEKAFGHNASIFENIAAGESVPAEDMNRFGQLNRDFEAYARQLRTLITTPAPSGTM